MGSGFDNSIYWIISRVVTTIRYYTFKTYLWHANSYNTLKVNTSTTELPWMTSSGRILSKKKSKLKLLYDWRFTANQFVLAWGPLRPTTRIFFQLNTSDNSPCVTSSLTRRWVCLLWIRLAFREVYVSHIQHVIENSSFCTTHKPSVSIGFTKQIVPRTVFTASYIGSARTSHRKHINCSATDIMHCCQACSPMHCLAMDAICLSIRCCDLCLAVCYLAKDALLLLDVR
jgi:hypothetical protein